MSALIALTIVVTAAPAQPAAAAQADLADPVVCRRSKLPDVGTRFRPKPVCLRKSDWSMFDKQNENELRQINQRGNNPGKAEGR